MADWTPRVRSFMFDWTEKRVNPDRIADPGNADLPYTVLTGKTSRLSGEIISIPQPFGGQIIVQLFSGELIVQLIASGGHSVSCAVVVARTDTVPEYHLLATYDKDFDVDFTNPPKEFMDKLPEEIHSTILDELQQIYK